MNIGSQIFTGVIGSIIATIIIAILVRLYKGTRKIRGLKLVLRLWRDSSRGGIINIFPDRFSYHKHKDHGKAGDYIKNCKKELIYTGYWLAHGTEMESIIVSLKELCLENKKAIIVLIDPNNSQLMNQMSEFLRLERVEMITRIETCLDKMSRLKNELNSLNNNNLEVYVHEIPTSYSAFMLDYDLEEETRILVDYKTYQQGREKSYGIEYKNRKCSITKAHAESMKSILGKSKKYVK